MVATAILILGVACAGIGAASAAAEDGKTNPMGELVFAIAQKFNLNEADVQKVFDEQRSKMETRRQQAFIDRIDKAVAAGKLTQAQAGVIKSKKTEYESLIAGLSGKAAAERNAKLEKFAAALKQWAADNNIPAGYLPMAGGMMCGDRGTVGKVTANDGTTVTISAKQPGSETETSYAVTLASGGSVKKIEKPATEGGKPVKTAIAISGIAVGDTISVRGTVSGTTISATEIIDGAMGMGHGRGGRGFGGWR